MSHNDTQTHTHTARAKSETIRSLDRQNQVPSEHKCSSLQSHGTTDGRQCHSQSCSYWYRRCSLESVAARGGVRESTGEAEKGFGASSPAGGTMREREGLNRKFRESLQRILWARISSGQGKLIATLLHLSGPPSM